MNTSDWRASFVADPNAASYFWQLQRNGVPFADEYDADGGEHSCLEWPGKPSTQFAPAFRATEPFEPYTLVARSACIGQQTLPDVAYAIRRGDWPVRGDCPVWGHRSVGCTELDPTPKYTYQIVGVMRWEGHCEISVITHEGLTSIHASIAEAHDYCDGRHLLPH